MRFFSNEAKDNVDEQENTGTPVPQQRAGSPWHTRSDEPGTVAGSAPARPADTDDDPDRTTALPGSSTTGSSSSSSDPDRTVAFDDGTHRAEPVQVNPAPTPVSPIDRDRDGKDDVDLSLDDRSPGDRSLDDRSPDDRFLDDRDSAGDPHATQVVHTGTPRDVDDKDGDGVPDAADKKDDNDFGTTGKLSGTPDSTVDDKSFGATDVTDKTDADDRDEVTDRNEPLIPPAPVTETTPTGPVAFFPAADTQPLRDRWRDVQLRFVDDPKGATSDASGLVDEAVDKLAAALRDHRGSFSKGSDDTEALRVEFRSYRDILDRLLGL